MPRFFGSVCKTGAVSALALAALSFGLASCGPADNDPGPGGVTVGEARALDEAAEMLDERQADPAAASAKQLEAASPQSER
jgi:hypothetical protein